jgi:SAM-dependent methyltransferase
MSAPERPLPAARELIADEAELMRRELPLAGARVVELGCGKAELARRLVERGWVASVTALEVDRRQHEANLASAHPQALRFMAGGAEAIPLPDASCDIVLMLKSLHHVPMAALDRALGEVRRVLAPGGWLYASEPVYAGDFNDIIKLFHDEGEVRAAAYAALQRAAQRGVLSWEREIAFDTPVAFRDFADFEDRIVRVTYDDRELRGDLRDEVRPRFERFMTVDGARFMRPMRVNVLRRAA